MEIFNIHIFEFLLIAGLALVVFGPERLPEVGRFVGKQVARVLAWQQNSPEARMLIDMRAEFEKEIVSLRDELVRTREQIDISGEVKLLDDQTRSILSGKQPPMIRPAGGQVAAAAPNKLVTPAEAAGSAAAPAEVPASDAITAEPGELVSVDGQPLQSSAPEPSAPEPSSNGVIVQEEGEAWVPPHRRNLHDAVERDLPPPAESVAPTEPAASPAGDQQLLQQIQALMSDMQALMSELQERGVIDASWQPPSQSREETVAR